MFEEAPSKILMGNGPPNRTPQDEVDGLIIRTVYISDCDYSGYVTYIEDAFDTYCVEKYNNWDSEDDDAAAGHAKWVDNAKTLKKVVDHSLYDSDDYGENKLFRMGTDAAFKEGQRRKNAKIAAEKRRKREAKRSIIAAYKPVADAFKDFPFKAVAQSSGSLGKTGYAERIDYVNITSQEDHCSQRFLPTTRHPYFYFELRGDLAFDYGKKIHALTEFVRDATFEARDSDALLRFRVEIDPWTAQKWVKKSGSNATIPGLW